MERRVVREQGLGIGGQGLGTARRWRIIGAGGETRPLATLFRYGCGKGHGWGPDRLWLCTAGDIGNTLA